MKFLANENFPKSLISALREDGFDIKWMGEEGVGATDSRVLEMSTFEGRILLTFDKDFGELVFRRGFRGSSGVILFRLALYSPLAIKEKVSSVLSLPHDWRFTFTVVELDRIRIRRLPGEIGNSTK